MDGLYKRWKRTPKPIRKSLVLIVGSAVVITGIAMLVLPGPGWAAIFLGFAILATEFAFAERVRDWLIAELKKFFKALQMGWQTLLRKRKK